MSEYVHICVLLATILAFFVFILIFLTLYVHAYIPIYLPICLPIYLPLSSDYVVHIDAADTDLFERAMLLPEDKIIPGHSDERSFRRRLALYRKENPVPACPLLVHMEECGSAIIEATGMCICAYACVCICVPACVIVGLLYYEFC